MNLNPTGGPGAPALPAVKKGGNFNKFKPYLAPFLITCILALGNFQYGILEGREGSVFFNNTALAIVTAILSDIVLALLATGRMPHLASSYITGISVGILLRTNLAWPYVVCSLLANTSKYALRVRGRHLWNPSNLGVSILLFLAPQSVAPLSQQWGNAIWVPLIIMFLGSLILYSLGRLHITVTYVVAFSALSFLRSAITDDYWVNEIALLTAPSYLLFMFFMITDPKTTTRTRARQCAVAVLVAVVETGFRLGRQIHAPYYALFWVAPITNLAEIFWDVRHGRKPAPAAAPAEPAGVPATQIVAGPVPH